MDFTVNGVEVGTHNSEVNLPAAGNVRVALKVSAYLDPVLRVVPHNQAGDQPPGWTSAVPDPGNQEFFQTPTGVIRGRPYSEKPYWHLERARIEGTREVPVEIVVDGKPVAQKTVVADGETHDVQFQVPIQHSSWIAARILPSSHTNPVFVIVGGKPMRPMRASAEWCLAAVNQCWTQKALRISARELPEARQAYDHAREVYQRLIAESQKE